MGRQGPAPFEGLVLSSISCSVSFLCIVSISYFCLVVDRSYGLVWGVFTGFLYYHIAILSVAAWCAIHMAFLAQALIVIDNKRTYTFDHDVIKTSRCFLIVIRV